MSDFNEIITGLVEFGAKYPRVMILKVSTGVMLVPLTETGERDFTAKQILNFNKAVGDKNDYHD